MQEVKNGVSETAVAHTWDNETVEAVERALRDKHRHISSTETPKSMVKTRADGFDYVEEGYMRNLLNDHYPVWSWEIIKYELLGSAWAVVHGRLKILDGSTTRTFDGISAHRIQTKRDSDEFVDIGNDMKSANSDALKLAMNRLCNIADDVYRKAYVLSEKQEKELRELMSGLDDFETRSQFEERLDSGELNATNYKRAFDYLTRQVTAQNPQQ